MASNYPETIETTVIKSGKHIPVTIKDGDIVLYRGTERKVSLGGIYCPCGWIPIDTTDKTRSFLARIKDISPILED